MVRNLIEHSPVVNIIQTILTDAVMNNVSDIHFEPYEKTYRVRFRKDGLLHPCARPPVDYAKHFASRLKVMADLNIAEQRLPQDGRFKFQISEHHHVDFRISTCPTLFGEKIVLRLLNPKDSIITLDQLGLEPLQHHQLQQALARNQGMILVTGPTGSGKTVTQYAALNTIDSQTINILTVEDPIEIIMSGINQVAVNHKTGLSFATALRTFLRQDPDVIMIGEIRDSETADIAIKAAQTGHLVLSTLHTNNAVQATVRLLNLGVKNYNIVSAVSLIVAQRLVRKLCAHCKRHTKISKEKLQRYGLPQNLAAHKKIFLAQGCQHCQNGYQGRTGIYELLPVNEKIAQCITTHPNSNTLNQLALQQGMLSLRQAAINKVLQGITTLDDISQVVF